METAEKIDKLYGLRDAVETANDAWFDALKAGGDGKAEKAAYKAALAEFRAYEDELLAAGTMVTCGRCGGDGVVHFGNITFATQIGPQRLCFLCGGAKVMPLRKHKLSAQATTRLKRAREHEAKMAAEAAERDAKWTAFASEHAEVAAFLAPHVRPDAYYDEDGNDIEFDDFLCSMRASVVRWGRLTEKQMAAVERSMAREEQKREAAAKLAEAGPLKGGTQTVEGEIVSWKSSEGYMGGTRFRATILLTTGHKINGTLSEKFWNGVEDLSREIGLDEGVNLSLEGLRVRMTCEIERKDESFGFYKRPRKVEILGHRDAEETAAALAAGSAS